MPLTDPTVVSRWRAARTGVFLLAAAVACVGVPLGGCAGIQRAQEERERREAASGAAEAGAALLEQGDLEAARLKFVQAIEDNPELAGAHLGLGRVYEEQNDPQSAEISYRRAAELAPASFDAQFRHGVVLQTLRRLTEAVRAYLRALAIRPEDFEANLNLSSTYLALDEPRQALPYARRAVVLDSRSGSARANLAATYADLGRHTDAVVEYQAAIELMDPTPDLLLGLADSLGRTERYPEMLNTLRALLAQRPSAAAYERLGYAHFRLREYDAALQAFREAIEEDPRHYPALNGIGVCQLNRYLLSGQQDRGARREAIDALRLSLRIRPDQPRIVELLSRYG